MKLVYYTYRKISLLLFVLMAVWGVLFYYAIIDEVMDETDDTLENYSEILINNALMDPSILDTEGTLMSFYKFRPISEEEAEDYLCEHTDPEHVDVQYIFNNYRPMGNALISYLRTRARPGRSEELISAEVLPGYYVCGSCDAVMGNSKVIDYKTTSALNAPITIPYEYKLQLLCYAYIYKKMGLPINAISIIWITHNQVNRISETTGKPMKDYPATVTDTTEYVGDEDFAFIESLLKLVAETVQASIDYPQLKHVIFKDYRLK